MADNGWLIYQSRSTRNLSICLSVYLSHESFTFLPVYLSIWKLMYVCACLSVYFAICHLFVFIFLLRVFIYSLLIALYCPSTYILNPSRLPLSFPPTLIFCVLPYFFSPFNLLHTPSLLGRKEGGR